MKNLLVIIFVCSSLLLSWCFKEKIKQDIVNENTQSWLVETWNIKQIENWQDSSSWNIINFSINKENLSVNLPINIWWDNKNLEITSIIASNDWWNRNTDLKTAPEWTIDTIWWEKIINSVYDELSIIDVNLILDLINNNKLTTYKRYDDSEMYKYWFEHWWEINISILKYLKDNWIKNFKKELFSNNLFSASAAKKIYTTKEIKNEKWEIIGYWNACSYSQDTENTISFINYCIITFDWNILKEYKYNIPEKFITQYDVKEEIKSKVTYPQEWKWLEYINSDFYKETTEFWKKEFNKLYLENKEFADYINELEKIAVENY